MRGRGGGDGPTLIEAKTYRYYGHFQGDTITYRTQDEVMQYRQRDPIERVRQYAIDHGIATAGELDAIDARVKARLDAAWEAAKQAPWPKPEEALEDVYVSY